MCMQRERERERKRERERENLKIPSLIVKALHPKSGKKSNSSTQSQP